MTHPNATPVKAIYLDEFIYEEGTPIGKCYQCHLPNPFTNNQVLTEGIDYVKQWQIRTLGLTEWNNCTQKEYETTYSFPQERRIKALPIQAEKEIKVAHAGNGYSGKILQAEKREGEKGVFPVQFGKSAGADFEERTWTFEMPDNFEVVAGDFAIVPIDTYNKLITNKG